MYKNRGARAFAFLALRIAPYHVDFTYINHIFYIFAGHNMSASQPSLTLIVAATVKNGIGKNGGLPWPMLKKEMAYFARVTKRVPSQLAASDKQAQNVVVMGRKTYESIPPKFRPLKDRTNLVISSKGREELGVSHEDVIVAQSIESGLKELQDKARQGTVRPMGKVFIIGGSSIYEAALRLSNAKQILLTRIQSEYDSDTFFPVDLEGHDASTAGWQKQSHATLKDFVKEDLEDADVEEKVGDSTVRYRFTLYERT